MAKDDFAGTWALVTGASSGLGTEFARQLAARKTNLVLTARRRTELETLAGELKQAHGVEVDVLTADLQAPGAATALVEEVDRRGRVITHLVSNAGFGLFGRFDESPLERLTQMVQLNCEALLVLSRHYLPRFLERNEGGIIHVASIAGYQAVPFQAVYGATKAFVLSLSEALAEEVRGSNVRVVALNPGPVETGFQAVAGAGISAAQKRSIMSAQDVVTQGLEGYVAGRRLVVPGALNRLNTFFAQVMPRQLVVRSVANMMRAKPESAR